MVASEQEESIGKLNLVCKQKTNRFNALLAPVYIVSKEQVFRSCFSWKAHKFKESKQINELSMNVSKYLAGSLQLNEYIFLFKEYS